MPRHEERVPRSRSRSAAPGLLAVNVARSRQEGARDEATTSGRREAGRGERRGERRQARHERPAPSGTEPFVVGLLAAPGFPYELPRDLSRALPYVLSRRFPGPRWRAELRPEPMAAASDDDVD